jgi:hypothetical protein
MCAAQHGEEVVFPEPRTRTDTRTEDAARTMSVVESHFLLGVDENTERSIDSLRKEARNTMAILWPSCTTPETECRMTSRGKRRETP